MTKEQVVKSMSCDHCGEFLRCACCGKQISGRDRFSQWIRGRKGLLDSKHADLTDIDGVWFRYRAGWLLTYEVKQFGTQRSVAQTDTQEIIRQMLLAASGAKYQTMRGVRSIRYMGHFVIILSRTTPDDSDWMTINGEPASEKKLLNLLAWGMLL